jgi:hypothetical protein
MIEKTTGASAQRNLPAVGWISDDLRVGYSGMTPNPVRSSIQAVASPKLLLTTAKILTAFIVAVAIMLLLVGRTFPPPDGKASSLRPSAAGGDVMVAARSARPFPHGSCAHSGMDGVLTSLASIFFSQSKERAPWLQTI